MFDITTTAVQETGFLHLKNAKGEHLFDEQSEPVGIRLYSPGTRQFSAIEQRMSQRALKRREENDGKATVAAPDVRRAEMAEDFAAITVEFVGFDYPPAGSKVGAARYQACYEDQTLGFIVKQIDTFVASWGNFATGSATS